MLFGGDPYQHQFRAFMTRVVIFDFDGVILESAEIKTEAFRELFSIYPEHVDRIVQYHINNIGISRWTKFDYIYSNYLKKELTCEEKEFLGESFSGLVVEKVKACPFVPGALEFLKEYHSRLGLYVVSATPSFELSEILDFRGLSGYFRKAYGSPGGKADAAKDILANEGIDSDAVILVGDSLADYDAAVEVGVLFVGRVNSAQAYNPFLRKGVHIITNLLELRQFINPSR